MLCYEPRSVQNDNSRETTSPRSFNYLELKDSGTLSALQAELLECFSGMNIRKNDISETTNEYTSQLIGISRNSAIFILEYTSRKCPSWTSKTL